MKNPDEPTAEEFPSEETMKLYDGKITSLFTKAKEQDEKEFMSSILYFTGIMTFSRSYDVARELKETVELFFNISGLRNTNPEIISVQNFFKLGLLVYCHIIETYPTLEFLYNLALLAQGKNYELFPFGNSEEKKINEDEIDKTIKELCSETAFENKKKIISKLSYALRITEMPVTARMEMVVSESKKADVSLEEILLDFYDKDIRNAFSHGLYALDDNGLMLIKKNKHISYKDLLDKITKALYFFTVLSSQADDVLRALPPEKESKFVGRLGEMSITPNYEGNFVSYNIQSTSLSRHI